MREELRVSMLTAWADYQATGLHVAAEEADAWLAKLEAGEDAQMPTCHAARSLSIGRDLDGSEEEDC
ncbi:MAG: hypothetical protein WBQ94_26145 [Terracidiphilus sp.]